MANLYLTLHDDVIHKLFDGKKKKRLSQNDDNWSELKKKKNASHKCLQ